MNKKQRLKCKKQKRRRKRIKHLREEHRRHERNVEQYPQFIIDPKNLDHVPLEFVQGVTQAAKRVRFNDQSRFTNIGAQVYRLIKKYGINLATQAICQEADESIRIRLHNQIQRELGEMLFQEMRAKGLITRFLPQCSVQVVCSQNIHLLFDALLCTKRPHGTIYHSRNRSTVTLEGKQYEVAYSRHAMQRIAERASYDPLSYGGAGDVYAYLAHQSRFTTAALRKTNGKAQPALEFFEQCTPGFFSSTYSEQILGTPATEASRFYYRLGYGALALDDRFAVALTFLTPGMRGTPEHRVIHNSGLSGAKKRNIQSHLERTSSMAEMVKRPDFSALKWVHEHGAPQIIEIDETPFDAELKEHQYAQTLLSQVVLQI